MRCDIPTLCAEIQAHAAGASVHATLGEWNQSATCLTLAYLKMRAAANLLGMDLGQEARKLECEQTEKT